MAAAREVPMDAAVIALCKSELDGFFLSCQLPFHT